MTHIGRLGHYAEQAAEAGVMIWLMTRRTGRRCSAGGTSRRAQTSFRAQSNDYRLPYR